LPLLLVLVALGAVFDGRARQRARRCGPTSHATAAPLPKLNAWGEARRVRVPVLVALGFAVGAAAGPINSVAALVIQHRTPEVMRGRVVGSYTSLAVAAGPLGLLAIGPVVDAGGPGAGYLVIGAGCLLAAAYALTGRASFGRPDPTPTS
jgi:hypothetical protein